MAVLLVFRKRKSCFFGGGGGESVCLHVCLFIGLDGQILSPLLCVCVCVCV